MNPLSLVVVALLVFTNVSCYEAQLADTSTIIALNQQGWKLRNKNIQETKKLAIEAIQAANSIQYPRGLSYSFNLLGLYYKTNEQYDSAEIYYRKSLLIRQTLKDTLNIARSYRNLMSIYKLLGNTKQAIEAGLMAIQLLTHKLPDVEAVKELAWTQLNLSALYCKMGDYEKASRSAFEGKRLFMMQEDDDGLAGAANNIGYIYEVQKLYDKALIEYQAAVAIYLETDNQRELAKGYNNIADIYVAMKKYGLALSEYRKSLGIRSRYGFADDVKNSLHNIGFVYEKLGKPDSARYYYDQALAMSVSSGNIESQYEAHRSLGAVLNLLGENKKALTHLLQSMYLSELSSAIPEKIFLLKEISETYQKCNNNDSALYYANEYSDLNDSLNEILRKSMQLESDLKDKVHDLAMSDETNKKQIIIITGISLALFLLLIIFWMYSRSVRSKKREFILKELIKEKELMAMDAMLEGQEEERKRLGAELHDTIGSILSAAKYAFKAMENSLEKLLDENKLQYQKINQMLDEAMNSVRRISHTMAAGILTEKGLEGALTELCDMFEQSGKIKITLNMIGFDRKIDYLTEISLYRIVQELMANIIKHAHAGNVNIQLIKNKENINLVVEDDGVGFNAQDPQLKKGIGILNIDNRIKKLSGTWNIDSGKGKGTTVIIDIPVNEEVSL